MVDRVVCVVTALFGRLLQTESAAKIIHETVKLDLAINYVYMTVMHGPLYFRDIFVQNSDI